MDDAWLIHGRLIGICFFHVGPCLGKRDDVPNPFEIVLAVFVLEKTDWPHRDLEPDLCFSTLVHVVKNGARFQTLSKSFWSFAFCKKNTSRSQMGLEPGLRFSTLAHVGK
jgi:hypothetical protein